MAVKNSIYQGSYIRELRILLTKDLEEIVNEVNSSKTLDSLRNVRDRLKDIGMQLDNVLPK